VALEDIPETGMHLEIDAPEPARSEIVPLAGVRELPRLSAVFNLSRRGAGVRVTGQVLERQHHDGEAARSNRRPGRRRQGHALLDRMVGAPVASQST